MGAGGLARHLAGRDFGAMMRRFRRVAACGPLALFAVAPRLAAQHDTLSVARARDRVLQTSPVLAAARASAEAAVQRERQAILVQAPELDAELGGEGPFKRVEGSLTYTVALRSSAKSRALRAVLDAVSRRVAAGVEVARRELLLRTTRAFYRAALLDQRVGLDSADADAVAALAANARARRALGTATDIDVLRLESEASAAERTLTGDRAQRDVARLQLAALLGASADSLPPLAFDLDSARHDDSGLRLAGAIALASVTTAELDLDRARAAVEVAHLYRWSDPRIGGGVGYQQGDPVLTAVVRIPLPTAGHNAHAIAAANLDVRAAEARLVQARRDSAAAVSAVHLLRRASAAQLANVRDDLDRRREAEMLARRRLDEGGPYLQIWLDVRRDRIALQRQELALVMALTTAQPMGDLAAGPVAAPAASSPETP